MAVDIRNNARRIIACRGAVVDRYDLCTTR
jgi:hypothetical protein